MNLPKNPWKYLLFSLLLILIDQASKILVHQYMTLGFAGQIALVGDWLKLHYVLNPGMAFGMELGHEYGKLFLTLFRLGAMFGIGWYLVYSARHGAPTGFLWAMAMILAGAVGNVIDSTFYGVFIPGNMPYGSPTPWFHGQVIDMIFVDFWEGFLPDWIPLWGGQYYSTPIFNIADSCIFIGVCIILIFQGRFFSPLQKTSQESTEAAEINEIMSDRTTAEQEANPTPEATIQETFATEEPEIPSTEEEVKPAGSGPETDSTPDELPLADDREK